MIMKQDTSTDCSANPNVILWGDAKMARGL
jgi:hypothetical protein